ncbi:GNAT family protein [soil metagenome]|jgi:RimJ/RimL family protein N-acetyltransferase
MADASGTPMIRGDRVFLRPAERSDIPLFVRWLNDAETSHFLALRAPLSVPMEEQWFETMLQHHGKDRYHFVICLLQDGRPIGTIGLEEIDHLNGAAAVGIAIGEKDLWAKGFGTDALTAMCDFGFGELRLERLWLDVYAFNERARRSYEKAGFTVEGTLRRAHFHRGQHHDVHRMALLREDWTVSRSGQSPSSMA